MHIVIDIPEYMYNDIKNCGYVYSVHAEDLASYIIGGTPLPRGHGRLVDIGKFEQKQRYADPWKLTRKVGQVIRDLENVELSELPTIIDADKVESEEI